MTQVDREEVQNFIRSNRRNWLANRPSQITVEPELLDKLKAFAREQADNLGENCYRYEGEVRLFGATVVAAQKPDSDRQAFLAAIIARPDDDLPRMIFADWLDERAGTVPCPSCEAILKPNGGGLWPCRSCGAKDWSEHGRVPNGFAERAEFIRVQCELAGQHPTICDCAVAVKKRTCRWCSLRRRELELYYASNGQWVEFLPFMLDVVVTPIERQPAGFDACRTIRGRPELFRRGFVEEITCSWSDWRTHADVIRAATPLRKVRLTTPPTGDHVHFELMRSDEDFVRCDLYPGIEFEMPQQSYMEMVNENANNFYRLAQAVNQAWSEHEPPPMLAR